MDGLSGAKADRPGLLLYQESLGRGDSLFVLAARPTGAFLASSSYYDRRPEGTGNRISFDLRWHHRYNNTFRRTDISCFLCSRPIQNWRLIQERTKAGLAAARVRGRKGGRPPLDPKSPRVVLAQKLIRDKSNRIDDICDSLKISRTTLYKDVSLQNIKDTRSGKSSE